MSYWIYLETPGGETVEFGEARDLKGGTYAVGGTSVAELNVTYNYGRHFRFRDLHEKTLRETVPMLLAAIERLGDDVSSDYWEPTEGNVKACLRDLLSMAEGESVECRWRVS